MHVDISDSNDWRIKNGGASRCESTFSPSKDQTRQGFFEGWDNYNSLVENKEKLLVYDMTLKDSWYGQETIKLLFKLRSGDHIPMKMDSETLKRGIIRVYEDNPENQRSV